MTTGSSARQATDRKLLTVSWLIANAKTLLHLVANLAGPERSGCLSEHFQDRGLNSPLRQPERASGRRRLIYNDDLALAREQTR